MTLDGRRLLRRGVEAASRLDDRDLDPVWQCFTPIGLKIVVAQLRCNKGMDLTPKCENSLSSAPLQRLKSGTWQPDLRCKLPLACKKAPLVKSTDQ